MNVLVVGGAGYIGSHTARWLERAGHDVWVYDDLSTGHRQAAPANRLLVGKLHDEGRLIESLRSLKIEAVMHFAASALVGESVVNPSLYYGNNVVGTFHLLEAMRTVGVSRIVFSSTTATYGAPETMPIRETQP
ncbi:MAG: GDP-mannose 4,6-dehydratase, partial [Pirellulaceae bacterium]|nr:GDP-mannose 4,6-dehydratase [Pirellulaceae bacterium]